MAAVVLYLDGQRPRDIAIIAAAVLVLLVTLVVIAPRLGEPEKEDAVPRVGHGWHAAPDETQQPGRMPPEIRPPSVPDPVAGPDALSPETAGNTPARQSKSGRRAKRGRRRR